MSRNAAFFTRVLADIFSGKAAAPGHASGPTTPTPQPGPAQPAPAANASPRVIGQGAANETHITIADEPNLFVEESQYVVQFKPAFDERLSDTPFGLKILPELIPHWSQVHIHRCSLKDALSAAICSGGSRPRRLPRLNRLAPRRPDHDKALTTHLIPHQHAQHHHVGTVTTRAP